MKSRGYDYAEEKAASIPEPPSAMSDAQKDKWRVVFGTMRQNEDAFRRAAARIISEDPDAFDGYMDAHRTSVIEQAGSALSGASDLIDMDPEFVRKVLSLSPDTLYSARAVSNILRDGKPLNVDEIKAAIDIARVRSVMVEGDPDSDTDAGL